MAQPSDFDRILFALDACCEVSDAVLDSVVSMAQRLDAALEGLFVEDQALMRAAELPFATEIGGEGLERVFDLAAMRRANESASALISQRLERAAGPRNVRWKLTVTAGSRLAAALAAAEHSDLLLAAHAARRRAAEPGVGFRRVCILYDASEQSARALRVVRALASNGHTREVSLIAASPLPAALLAELHAAGLRTFTQAVATGDTGVVLREAGGQGAGLLILPKQRALGPPPSEARLLEALALPLLLLR